MKMRMMALAGIVALTVTAANGCEQEVAGQSCGDGKGTWIEDESGSLKGGYSVIVRLCVDDGGNVIDLDVE